MSKMPFEDKMHVVILQLMLRSPTFLTKCRAHIKPSYLQDNYHAWFFDFIISYYKRYGEPPPCAVIRSEILKFSPEDRPAYERILADVLTVDIPTSEAYIKDQLTAFARRMYTVDSLKEMTATWNKGQDQAAISYLQTFAQDIIQIEFAGDDLFDIERLEALLAEERASYKHRMPLAIPQFDAVMRGGLARGYAMLLAAPTNCGKSMCMINLARNFMEQGKKVLYINLEEAESRFAVRLVSSISRVSMDRLGAEQMTAMELRAIDEAKELIKEQLLVKNWYDYGVSVDDLTAFCHRIHIQHKFDVVIVDYLQLLKLRGSGDRPTFEVQQGIANALVALARQLKTPLITAVQINRDGTKKAQDAKNTNQLLRLTDIAECYGVVRPMDVVITMTRSDKDVENRTMKLLLEKNRDGKTQIAVSCELDFDSARMLAPELACQRFLWQDKPSEKSGTNDGQLDSLIQ